MVQILGSINVKGDSEFNNHELQNAVLHKGTSFPASPVVGQKFYNTSTDKEFVYTSAGWSENKQELTQNNVIDFQKTESSMNTFVGSSLNSLKYASTAADDNTVGTITWNSPSNAEISDNLYATASYAGTSTVTTHYLKLSNYSFAIPTSAEILGIKVSIERKASHSVTTLEYVRDSAVKLLRAGVVEATNKAITATNWGTTETTIDYGSGTDMWSAAWTPADINDTDFGIVLSCAIKDDNAGVTVIASVDCISITVYYKYGGQVNCTTITKPNRIEFKVIGSNTWYIDLDNSVAGTDFVLKTNGDNVILDNVSFDYISAQPADATLNGYLICNVFGGDLEGTKINKQNLTLSCSTSNATVTFTDTIHYKDIILSNIGNSDTFINTTSPATTSNMILQAGEIYVINNCSSSINTIAGITSSGTSEIRIMGVY